VQAKKENFSFPRSAWNEGFDCFLVSFCVRFRYTFHFTALSAGESRSRSTFFLEPHCEATMSNPIGDRNLLFGILAVQKNIISPDAFVAAMKEWSAEKKKGLAQILREQNAITENHHAVLEELVDQNLAGHGNDAQKSLQAVSLAGPARQGLEQLGDADVTAGLAQVPVEPPKPQAKPEAPPVKVVKPAVVKKPDAEKPVKPIPRVAPKTSGVPGWVLLAGGAALGVIVAVAATAAVFAALFFWANPRPANDDKGTPIAQEKPEKPKAKDPDKKADEPVLVKPPVKDPDEPPIVKPPVKEPDEPVLVKPPAAKGGLEAEFILELPRPAGRALLSADGLRVAYTPPDIGSFAYREGPAFDQVKTKQFDGVLTAIHPLASSLDGKKMALTAGAKDGPKVYVWNWETQKVQASFPFTNLAISSAFSPDGRYLATYLIQTPKGKPVENWFHLHDIAAGKAVSKWQLTSAPHLFGFTPDSRKVFFAAKGDQTARAWSVDDVEPSVLPFAQITKKYTFTRDFSRYAYLETPTQLKLGTVDGQRSLGKIDINKENNPIKAAAYSPDNRFVLIGTEDSSKRPLVTGKAMLVDLVAGKTISAIDKLDGVPDRAEIAANGVALFQGANLRPCLYRFPTGPENLLVNAPVVPTPGFVPLFNGKDLRGWKLAKLMPGNWRVENGVLVGSTFNKMSGRLYSERTLARDFHLRVEARLAAKGGAEVYFRCPDDALVGNSAAINGLFLDQITVGGLFSHVPGKSSPLPQLKGPLAPFGQWVVLDIIVEGERVMLKVNGKTTTDAVDAANVRSGRMVLLVAPNSTIEFRRIEIKEMNVVAAPPPAPLVPAEGFVSLFNGKDLTGWKTNRVPPGDWRVIDGILTGSSPNVRELYTLRDDYGDFHLRLEGRINADGNNWVVLRYPHGEPNMKDLRIGGYAVRVSSSAKDLNKTGSLNVYERVGVRTLPVNEPLVPPGQWFTMDIFAVGNQIDIKVNGQLAKSFVNPKTDLRGGRIVLGFGDTNRQTVVEYRRIEIKEFKAVPAPPQPPPEGPLGEFISVLNGKDLAGWRIEGNDGWKVAANGDLVGFGPDTALITKRSDYRSFIAKIEVMATADTDAFFAFRQTPDPDGKLKLKGLTSRITGDGALIRAGYAGTDAARLESGNQQIQLKAGEWMALEFQVKQNGIRITANGQATGGLNYAPDRHPAGAIGLHIAKGTVRIRKFEISAEGPGGAVIALPPPPLPPPAFAPVGDFVPLFNGKDLTGWKPHKEFPGEWRVEKGILIASAPAMGLARLHTERPQFKDFHLRLEARSGDKCIGTVGFRSPDGGLPGYNAAINSIKPGGVKVGGLLSQDRKGAPLPRIAEELLPPGQWFTLDVIAQGERLIVLVDGKKTTDTVDASFPAAGYISLGLFGPETIEFRKVEIRELKAIAAPPPILAAGNFVPLFNGKDLAGWQPHLKTAANWRVEKGILTGAGEETGILHTARADYHDFHLRMETRFTAPPDADSSSMIFRSPFGRAGYETVCADGKFSGGLYLNGKDFGKPVPPKFPANIVSGEWFLLEFLARDNRLTVKVNGKETTDFVDAENLFKTGHIVLRQGAGGKIEFRKIAISELKPAIAAPPPPPPEPELAKGAFAALFNGKDLTGWQPHAKRPGNWRVENGILIGSAPNGGSLYSTRNDYQDFHLRAEMRINDKGFGRVFGRAGYDPTKIPFKVIGYEILINQRPLGDKTGTLTATSFLSTTMTRARETPAAPGEWFLLEVVAKGDLVTVKVNGVMVADFQDTKRQFARTGHIALHQDANAVIEFRKVEIDDLSAPKVEAAPPPRKVDPPAKEPNEGGFVPLFNGKDLAGWKTFGKDDNNWRVENGILIGSGKTVSRLHSPRDDYQNFHLRVEACIHDLSAAGVIVRAPFSPFKGYQALINSTHPAANKTGGLEAHVPGKPINLVSVTDPPVPFGAWFTMEIIVQGKRITVLVNGKTTADFADVDDAYRSGHVALRHEPNSTIEFRKIEIKELPAR
jgi:hypothetical protein